jgi:hypothetical protein
VIDACRITRCEAERVVIAFVDCPEKHGFVDSLNYFETHGIVEERQGIFQIRGFERNVA